MKRFNSVASLFSFNVIQSFSKRPSPLAPKSSVHTPPKAGKVAAAPRFEHYIDGQTYRKLASHDQAKSAIQGFFTELAGREANVEDVMNYVQQWNDGRSLRSIRDEIVQCYGTECWL